MLLRHTRAAGSTKSLTLDHVTDASDFIGSSILQQRRSVVTRDDDGGSLLFTHAHPLTMTGQGAR